MLTGEILRHLKGNDRLFLDLPSGASWLLGRMAELYPTVLVPLAPDMNSVISLQAVERLFRATADSGGRPMQPYYVLNQFDAALALHLDVREVLRRQLGDRLLRVAIRRSPAVSEALAEGMTVLDYAPDAPVAQDYREVASWLKTRRLHRRWRNLGSARGVNSDALADVAGVRVGRRVWVARPALHGPRGRVAIPLLHVRCSDDLGAAGLAGAADAGGCGVD